MVIGQKKVVVFDLDGTLCSVNTYKVFVVLLILFSVTSFQFLFFSQTIKQLKLKLEGKISRWELKKELFVIHDLMKYKIVFLNILLFCIKLTVRKKILKNFQNKGFTFVLATAAYKFYSEKLGLLYGFDKIIATTKSDIDNDRECIGKLKRNKLERYMKGSKIDVFLTDHSDDSPTMMISNVTYLICPSRKSKMKIMQLGNEINLDLSLINT